MTDIPLNDHRRIIDEYETLPAFVEEMERPGGVDKLAILIERSPSAPIDEPILRLLDGKLLPQLAMQDPDGNNAFRRACFRKQFAAAKVFLEALSKSEPDTINETIQDSVSKGTLLHFAAMTGKHEILRFLLQNKACVGQIDNEQMTAWDIAVAKRDDHATNEFAAHLILAGVKGHWYRRRVVRRKNGAPILTLTKNTELPADTEMNELDGASQLNDMFMIGANKVSNSAE